MFSVARSSREPVLVLFRGPGSAALRGSTNLYVDPKGFLAEGATDYTDNTGRGLHGQQEAPDYTDNTGHRSHGQHGSVCRDGQCFLWPERCTRVSPGVFRGPGSAALRGSNQPIRRSKGLSRRSAPRITRINTGRGLRTTDANTGHRSHGQHCSVCRGRPVCSVARSSHARQFECFPWAKLPWTQGNQNQLIRRSRVFSRRRAPRITRITRDAELHGQQEAPDYTNNTGHRSNRTGNLGGQLV